MDEILKKLKKLYAKPFVKAGIDSALIHYISEFLKPKGLQIVPIQEKDDSQGDN